jgi:hypothetical protein
LNKAEFKGLKGAGITILYIMEKTAEPVQWQDFTDLYTDKTAKAAFECLVDSEIIEPKDDGFVVTEKYIIESGIIPNPTTTRYINKLIKSKLNKSSSTSELFREDIYILLKSVGVGEPKLSKLAELQHATEYFEGHIANWQERRKTDKRIRVGLLITLLESGIDPETEHEPDYEGGVYAGFVKT